MQEAYRPRRIKYSICYPRWGTPWRGVPPGQTWWGVPEVGYPPAEVPPGQIWRGEGTWGGVPPWQWYPPAGVPPGQVWPGRYLRWVSPGRGTPLPAGPGWGIPLAGPGRGTPRDMDRQTPVKTVPYRRTTYAVGKYVSNFIFSITHTWLLEATIGNEWQIMITVQSSENILHQICLKL